MSTSDEADDSDRSLPPTSERIKELISNTINRILSALSLSSGNLKLLVRFLFIYIVSRDIIEFVIHMYVLLVLACSVGNVSLCRNNLVVNAY